MLSYKHTRRLGMLTGLGISLLYPISVFAQGATDIFAAENFIASITVKILTTLNLLTWILFGFLNFLLDPRFMFDLGKDGKDGAFMDILNQIWQLSRDIANLGFAIVLVVAAVVVIATANKDFISGKIQKFVLAIILVNFSWFLPRVVLDVANVATSSIFGIPSLIGQTGADKCTFTSAKQEEGCTAVEGAPGRFSCPCIIITNMKLFVDNWEEIDDDPGWDCPGRALFCYQSEIMKPDTVASYSAILNGLVVNHGRLRELGRVPASLQGGGKVSDLIVFLIREIILIVFHIAFFFPLLAMTVAFFLRIPVLWVTIAFMPFVFLGKMLPGQLKDYTDKILDHFIKAAFLPAMVAIPLSIGFIMINAGSKLTGQQAAGVSLRLFDGVSNLWELMWMCMSMGILWVGVFNVLSKSEGVIGAASNTIQGIGQSWGKKALIGGDGKGGIIGKIPLPTVSGGKTTVGEAWKGLKGGAFGAAATTASASDMDRAAKDFSADPGALKDFTKSVKALTERVKNKPTFSRDDQLKAINKKYNVAGSATPHEDLEKLLQKLKKSGAKQPEVEALEKAIKELKDAWRSAPQTASTGQTGTGVPPFRYEPGTGFSTPGTAAPGIGLASNTTIPPNAGTVPPVPPAGPSAPETPSSNPIA